MSTAISIYNKNSNTINLLSSLFLIKKARLRTSRALNSKVFECRYPALVTARLAIIVTRWALYSELA